MAGKKGSSKSSSGNKGMNPTTSTTSNKSSSASKRSPVQKGKKVKVVQESATGRNERFRDPATGQQMTRAEFVRRIEQGQYPDYHVREVDGVKTPASNPDTSEGNNLG